MTKVQIALNLIEKGKVTDEGVKSLYDRLEQLQVRCNRLQIHTMDTIPLAVLLDFNELSRSHSPGTFFRIENALNKLDYDIAFQEQYESEAELFD
jgi:hypothetical protein